MTYRVRRKFTSSTFYVEDQLCKVCVSPEYKYEEGHYFWKVGFAVGKSRRQLNDWWNDRSNKRKRSIKNQFTGKVGMKAIRRGFQEVLRLRWVIQSGDFIELDCTSGDPDRQFHAWSRWHKHHPEWILDTKRKAFRWYRPPLIQDPVRKHFKIVGLTPKNLYANTAGSRYFDCFQVFLKDGCTALSIPQTADLLTQLLAN
jgi:hypothetical protein